MLTAVDRAKQITMTELNAVIGVSVNFLWQKKMGEKYIFAVFPHVHCQYFGIYNIIIDCFN